MKIGLISDTHAPAMGSRVTAEVIKAFTGVDLILHAGDIYSSELLDSLEDIAPVVAVEVPPAPVTLAEDPRVEYKRIVEVEGHKIGLVHDLNIRGIDEFMPGGKTAERFATPGSLPASLAEFFGQDVDIAVFGHTHWEMVEFHDGILLVNPGSPTLPHQSRRLGNVAVMEVTRELKTAQIVSLKDLSEA